MRSGLRWLKKHTIDRNGAPLPVDYDEMLRQLCLCEEKYGDTDTCGCDGCPNLKKCRSIFDARCPKTPMSWEVLENRPWCCGHPMKKDGSTYANGTSYHRHRCRYCGRVAIDKAKRM